MSDTKERSDIIIEGPTATWELRAEGLIDGSYRGNFRFKCYLTPMDQIAANREYRELVGPHPTFAPQHETFLAYAITQLKYRIVSAPPFWNVDGNTGYGGNIPDEDVLTQILDAAIDSEVKYKGQLKKKQSDALARSKKAVKAIMEKNAELDKKESEEDAE